MSTYFGYANAVRDSQNLSSTEKLVALIIASHFNWADMNPSFPTNQTLAKKTGFNVRTIIRAKNSLIEKGWLSSQRRYNKSNLYTPTIPRGDTMSLPDAGGDTMSLGGCHNVMSRGDTEYNLIDNITNNLIDNNNQSSQEEEGLFLDLTKEDIKNLDLDKDIYLKIIKDRAKLGIFD